MRVVAMLIAVLTLASCSVMQRAIGAGGNPEPNLKSIHMWGTHTGFTKEDFAEHPDHDCYGDYILIEERDH